MGSIKCSRRINAPSDRVFALATDYSNAAEFITGITKTEMLTEGPVGEGTRFRETRIMFKREATEEMEVTAYEPDRRVVLGCESCGGRYRTEFLFEPDGDTTNVHMDMAFTPLTLSAKLMMPISKLFSGMVRKEIEKDLADLAVRAEQSR